jgi:GTP diphosphokinase / guanosine-3',5'-bis(diphosphate) 3'-diphosphatase
MTFDSPHSAEAAELASLVDWSADPPQADPAAVAAMEALATAFAPASVPPLVRDALEMALAAHAGQYRASGELYVSHPLHVAAVCAAQGFDAVTVAAAVCHDVVEDSAVTVPDVEHRLGAEVAQIVDGVSKVARVRFESADDAASASMTKFLVAVVDDVRVLVVKLADRLHNLRTIAHVRRDKQLRSAREALEVFSPLAHRLGLEELRCEMEDLAFAVLHPDVYAAVNAALSLDADARAVLARTVVDELAGACTDQGIAATFEWRAKHLWSIHTKSQRDKTPVSEMNDLVGVRVMVASIPDCYRALGAVHGAFTPVPGRFKDLIALPRPSGYRSLHTTVIVASVPVEVQIRTVEMHLQARFGVAAHYRYKDPSQRPAGADEELVDALASAGSPEEFLEALRRDLAPASQVVTLTPKGRPVSLPTGANVIDFAYKIHTDIGHRCVGARVNNRLVPIRTMLRTGDVVEVICGQHRAPSRDWLDHVVTAKARERIRKFFAERTSSPSEVAAAAFATELRSRGAEASLDDPAFVDRLCRLNGAADLTEIYERIAAGTLRADRIVGIPRRRRFVRNRPRPTAPSPAAPDDFAHRLAELLAGLPFSVAQCCQPTSLDEASAYITPSRSVAIHRSSCPNYLATLRALPSAELGRLWNLDPATGRKVVEVAATDRVGLLRDCSQVLTDHRLSIMASATATGDALAQLRFELEVLDDEHLAAAVAALGSVPSVVSVSVAATAG